MLLAPPKLNSQDTLGHQVYYEMAINPSNSSIHCCEAGLSRHSTDKRIGRQCKGIRADFLASLGVFSVFFDICCAFGPLVYGFISVACATVTLE